MTTTTIFPALPSAVAFDQKLSTRSVVLVFAALACVVYAIWHRTVPSGTVAQNVDPDTMCFIYRFGLGGFCR